MTPAGRIYYVDHNTQTTTWEKPRVPVRRPSKQERGANPGPVEQVRGSGYKVTMVVYLSTLPMCSSIPTQDPDLPPGWEMRKDKSGRTYYVDHNTRVTQWVG